MKFRLLYLLPAIFLAGCGDLLTLHALYTPEDQVFDPAMEGRWENKDNIAVISRNGDYYEMTLSGRGPAATTSKWEVHLVDIHGLRFADILPADQIGHMIVRVKTEGGKLRVAFMDTDWLRAHVPHEEADIERNRKQAVLTLKTPQLQSMTAKYALEPKAYDKEIEFQKVR